MLKAKILHRNAAAAFWIAAFAVLCLFFPLKASAAYDAWTTYEVDCYSLVVRESPDADAAGYAKDGTQFYVSKVSGDWLYTESIAGTSGKTISGWVYAPLCCKAGSSSGGTSSGSTAQPGTQQTVSSGTVTVTAPVSVTMRAEASADAEAIDWIGKGTVLTVLDKANGFYKVKFAGQTGWISSNYAESSSKASGSSSGKASGSSSGSSYFSGKLDWQKSYAYAEKYCYSPNPNYRYYDYGNCMTYISQILVAGGLPTTKEFQDETYPFIRIENFVPYMNRTYGISKLNNPATSSIEAGDCVLTDNGVHIMWVLSVDGSTVYACGNTNNRWYYALDAEDIDAVVKTSELF